MYCEATLVALTTSSASSRRRSSTFKVGVLGERALQDVDALGFLASPVQGVPERERYLGLPVWLARERQGVAEVGDHVRRADVRLDAGELDEQLGALVVLERLLERSCQVAHGALEPGFARRAACGVAE